MRNEADPRVMEFFKGPYPREHAEHGDPAIEEQIAFRPLRRDDFADMIRWNRAPHVATWQDESDPLTFEEAESKLGPRIDGLSPVTMHIVEMDGRSIGFLQHHLVKSFPEYLAQVEEPNCAAIDYIIGEESFTGRGLGPKIIQAYIDRIIRPAYPDINGIVATPSERNLRSHRTLEKLGFNRRKLLFFGENQPDRLFVYPLQGA